MTCGLVHASYSLPEWQAVKLTFFAPCMMITHPHHIRFLHERSTHLQVLALPLLPAGSVWFFLPPVTSWFDKMCCLVPILMPDSQQTKMCINVITVSFGLVSHGDGKRNIQGMNLWLRSSYLIWNKLLLVVVCSNIAELQILGYSLDKVWLKFPYVWENPTCNWTWSDRTINKSHFVTGDLHRNIKKVNRMYLRQRLLFNPPKM